MSEQLVIPKAFGAVNALGKVSDAVKDGEISTGEQSAIIAGARLQNGKLDPNAISRIEGLAKQMQALAAKLTQVQRQEARPTVDLAAFPIPRAELSEDVLEAVSSALFRSMPMSMSQTATIRGAAAKDGGFEVLVAIHSFMSAPTPDSDHYRVSVAADGSAGAPQRVQLAPRKESRPERFKRAIALLESRRSSMPMVASFDYIMPELSPAIGVHANAKDGPGFDLVRDRLEEMIASFLEANGFADLVTRNYLGNTIVVVPEGGGFPL